RSRGRDRMAQPTVYRRSIALIVIALVVAIMPVACGSSATPSPSPSASAASGLDGTWKLTTYTDATGAKIDVPAGVAPTTVFTGATVAGNGGCNTFNGQVTVNGPAITFSGVSSTQKACEAPASTVESAYFAALNAVTQYAVSGSTLILSGPDGKPSLTFAKSA